MINRINDNLWMSSNPEMNEIYALNVGTIVSFAVDSSRLNLRNTGALLWSAKSEELEERKVHYYGINLASTEISSGRKVLVLCQSHKIRQIALDILSRFGFSAQDFDRLVGADGK